MRSLKTHKPFKADIRLSKLKQPSKKIQPVANYATMIEDMIQEKIDETVKPEDETEAHEGEAHPKAKVDEHLIRRTITKALQN